MNADKILELARITLDSAKPFPEIVAGLIASGVEYYYVDYVTRSFRFYGAAGAMVEASLSYEQLPPIADTFDAAALKGAILDSQRHGQKYRDFCKRAMQAGVQGYFAFLRGQRVTYLGRQGDQHTEWFPGAQRP
jgi:uncharacterized protein YbcV (DUF1398 family)